MKVAITIEVDTDSLSNTTDEHLLHLWHVAQANPAAYGDKEAVKLAESLRHEIVRRWIDSQTPGIWNFQGHEHLAKQIEDQQRGVV